jgi:hypothetical protein
MTDPKRMTPTQLAAEWKGLAEQERARADAAEEMVLTVRDDLARAEGELRWHHDNRWWVRLIGRLR